MQVGPLGSALRCSLVKRGLSSLKSVSLEMSEGEGVSLKSLVGELEKFASPSLAESWDNVGLLVESPINPQPVSTVLLTNDLTEPVLQEALDIEANFILSYHPPIFAPLKRITTASWKEKIIGTCLAKGIAIYSPHTSWDAVECGVGDWLTEAFSGHFDVGSRRPIIPSQSRALHLSQVIAPASWAPPRHIPPITKIPLPDGGDTWVFIASQENINALQDPACEISQTELKMKGNSRTGMGRIINVNNLTLKDCVAKIKAHTGLPFVRLAVANNSTPESRVSSVAFVPGSGGSLLKGVKADLYVTGEMGHHEVLEATHNNSSVILTDHSNSERGFLKWMKKRLDSILHPSGVKVLISTADADPLTVV